MAFELIKSPEKINMLKRIGFSVGEFLGGIGSSLYEKSHYIDPNEIHLEWMDNGEVKRESIE